MSTACDRLCTIAEEAAAEPGRTPRAFLVAFGERAAGVRSGPLWWVDAVRGGRNHVLGGGFRDEYDDETAGQARHFAGTAAVAARLGTRLTRLLVTHVLRDAPDSADGRLSEAALTLTRALRRGSLAPADAAGWIREHVCD